MRSPEQQAMATDAAAPAAALRGVLASLALAMLLPSLGISIANVALPTLAETFGASFGQVQWVVLAYLLASTTLIVSVGRLGDLLGRRRLLMVGIAGFTVASGLCAAAGGLWWLVAARALQGLAAAVLMALSLALVAEVVPKSHTGRAMGLLGTMSAVGTALGPTLGGVLITHAGWTAIFLVMLPPGLLALWLVWRHLPADRRPKAIEGSPAAAARSRFDLPGSLLLAAGLAAYALAMTSARNGFDATSLAWLLAAALAGGLFLRVEARAPAPLVPLAQLRDPALRAGLAGSALVSTVIMATLVVGPFYLVRALGLSTTWVGLVMSTGPLVAALSGVPAGRLVDHFGAPRMTRAGLLVMLIGCAAMSGVPGLMTMGLAGIAGYVLPLVIVTAGYALFQAANNSAVMSEVAADRRGVVSGLLTLSRNLGLITGAAALGAVFAWGSHAAQATTPAAEALAATMGLRVTFGVAMALLLLGLFVARGPGALVSREPKPHTAP